VGRNLVVGNREEKRKVVRGRGKIFNQKFLTMKRYQKSELRGKLKRTGETEQFSYKAREGVPLFARGGGSSSAAAWMRKESGSRRAENGSVAAETKLRIVAKRRVFSSGKSTIERCKTARGNAGEKVAGCQRGRNEKNSSKRAREKKSFACGDFCLQGHGGLKLAKKSKLG